MSEARDELLKVKESFQKYKEARDKVDKTLMEILRAFVEGINKEGFTVLPRGQMQARRKAAMEWIDALEEMLK